MHDKLILGMSLTEITHVGPCLIFIFWLPMFILHSILFMSWQIDGG